MEIDQSQREQAIFKAALGLGTPEERRAYVSGACGEDVDLRQRVEALLAGYYASQSYLPTQFTPASPPREASGPQEGPGTVMGHYKLLQKIGEGGCGVVYMAEQAEPVRRRVALKIIKLGMDTKSMIARFEAERQALALMEHANIAKVLDAGTTESGRPYFVMDLVRGIKITEYCDQNNLAPRERLELFIQVCHAIQHAHQKGIIHRDIKPSNILVSLHDGVPVPVVIDFGIAKATEQPLTDKTMFTAFEQFIGTPAYMSPEQAELSRLDIDTRSDIYSLGVLLYELLTGKTPFDSTELLAAGVERMRRTIREQEPVRPSTRLGRLAGEELTTTAKRRRTEAPKLIHLVKGDLDWIVMKCLEKDRTRRYETANGLALDIERYLNNEPVVARPPTAAYKVQKFIRRNKVMVGAAGLVALALVLGILASTWQAARARKESQRARANAELARRHLYAADMVQALQALEINNLGHVKKLLDKYLPADPGPGIAGTQTAADPRGWEWRYLWRMCQSDELKTLSRHPHIVSGVAFSPDGRKLASQDHDGEVTLWDMRTETELARMKTPVPYWSLALAFTAEGKLVTANFFKGVETWDPESRLGLDRYPVEPMNQLSRFAVSPKGAKLAIGHTNGMIRLWDMATKSKGAILTNITRGESFSGRLSCLAFSPDGSVLAGGNRAGTIRMWNVASGQVTHTLTNRLREGVPPYVFQHVTSMAFSPDGMTLAAGGWEETIKLWDVSTGLQKTNLAEHIGRIDAITFSSDGKTIAAASTDYAIRLWDAATYRQIARLKGHLDEIWSLAFAPDGQTLASGSKDRTVKLWSARPRPEETPPVEFESSDFICRPSPDGKWFASITTNGTATLWEAATLREKGRIQTGKLAVNDAAVSPGGAGVAVGTGDGKVKFWNFVSHREEPGLSGLAGSVFPFFSPDGSTLLTLDDETGRLWDLGTRGETANLHLEKKFVSTAAFSPDGRRLALAFSDQESADWMIGLWDTVDRRWVQQVKAHLFWIDQLAFSPDKPRLASASSDGTAKIWDLADLRQQITTLKGPLQAMGCVGFSPDGKRLFTAGGPPSIVQLWDTETFQQVAAIRGNDGGRTLFFPNNDSLLTVGWKTLESKAQSAVLWRASSFEEIRAAERARVPTQ